ncbi:unnamed protein product [Oreochromis niloticus]|nr:unnamed protein product [Mustela putorius furo]
MDDEFEGTSSQMVIFSKNDRTGVEEKEAREWVPKSVSSSEDDGTDDWKPTQDESEGYSEEEEEQERKRIPKVAMKNKTGCPVPQREMAAASEEDGTHDSRPTQDESKDDSKDEAEHLGQMIHKVAMEKMEITQVYPTQHSTRGRGRALSFPLLPGIESVDSCLLPPAPKKRTRIGYSTDQLEHLEALFQEDHYPDVKKRKVIAASVGVTPQRIMVWFQNRRAKWRKVRGVTAKVEHGQSRAEYSPHHQINPTLPTLAHNSKGAASLSRYDAPKLPQLAPVPPSFPTITTQSPPSHSSLLSSLSSPGESRVMDTGQHQLSSQEGLVEYPPRPMQSPPPLQLASLPLFTMTFNFANPTPPLLNTPAHTPPLFLDALEGGSTLAHHETQSLPTDTSLLFDLDYLTSSQQSNTLSYQLQTSYPTSQPQLQPQASLPHMTYLTPPPYLTLNPPESNPTSYLTFGPGGNSTGVVTDSTTGHACFQSQSAIQILLHHVPEIGMRPTSVAVTFTTEEPLLLSTTQATDLAPSAPPAAEPSPNPEDPTTTPLLTEAEGESGMFLDRDLERESGCPSHDTRTPDDNDSGGANRENDLPTENENIHL